MYFFKSYLFYRNVPVRQMSATELAEVEKKVQEIEKGSRTDDIDEDDAGKNKIIALLTKKQNSFFIRR